MVWSFLFLFPLMALDFNEVDTGQLPPGTILKREVAAPENNSPYFGKTEKVEVKKNLETNGYILPEIIEERPEVTEKEDPYLVGGGGNSQIKIDPEATLKYFQKKTTSSMQINYFHDGYSYLNGEGNFKPTFRESKSEGPFFFQLASYSLSPLWGGFWGKGINLGLGYNYGKGIFKDGQQSEASIILWTIPLDLGLLLQLRYQKLNIIFNGGPSVMGLIQNRSDLESSNNRKNIRQYSPGFFGQVALGLGIGSYFSENLFKLISTFSVNELLFTISARYQTYSSFKDQDVSISGLSFGAGFTFQSF